MDNPGLGVNNEEGQVLLLRHAGAGERLASPSSDRLRRLDQAGRDDARRLVWTLADREFDRIVSSPLPRSVETVIPIAERRRLVIEQRDELLPEAPVEATLELLAELSHSTLVCTHREVIDQLFWGGVTCEKAGAWVLERTGSLWSPTAYVPPPANVLQRLGRTASVS